MREALRHFVLLGIHTNIDHLQDILALPAFLEGELSTTLLDEHLATWSAASNVPDLALAATALADPVDANSGARDDPVGPSEFRMRESTSDGRHHTVFAVRNGRSWWVYLVGRTYHLEQIAAQGTEQTAGELTAPIPGTVTEIPVRNGDKVEAGQVVMVISAMKMQLKITAPHAGVVRGLGLAVGGPVNGGRELLMIEALDG